MKNDTNFKDYLDENFLKSLNNYQVIIFAGSLYASKLTVYKSFKRLYKKLIKNKKIDKNSKMVFIDDGSKDNTLKEMKELKSKDDKVRFISFSRNFGKEAAMFAGIEASTGDYVTLMDADLQDPPRLLPEMFKAIKEEGYDSAATRRVTRKGEPPIRSFFARMFYKIMNKISDTELMDGARDYRLMTRQFVNSLLEMKEYNRFSKGLFGWVGYQTKWIEF